MLSSATCLELLAAVTVAEAQPREVAVLFGAADAQPTRGTLIGAAELGRVQPAAFLINTSRGDLIDETALREAIVGGRLAGAGLDVVQNEPSEVNPFADLPQVLVTPHSAGLGRASMPRALEQAAANVARFLRGEPVLNLVTR